MLLAWIDKNLAGTDSPRKHGKALHGQLKEYWRYRVADYRILAEIQDDKLIIFIARIGKRDNVYDN
jgi:mRNA interferase RelE/StbE